MRRSKVRARLQAGEFVRVCSLGHYIPLYVRHAAHNGYDAIWIDLEHATLAEREVQSLLALCHAHDIDGMVRPPTQERTRMYRYLENGASGLMAPMVSDVETARAIVSAVKYPPEGERGFAGGGLDADYALDVRRPGSSYIADANRETFILAQIETPEGVANAETIAAVAGIDALFVGPADLGLRLATLVGARPTLAEAVERVAAAARRHGKAWGITAGSLDALTSYRVGGAQIVPWGWDFALMDMLSGWSRELDKVLAQA